MALALLGVMAAAPGCAVDGNDLARWQTTQGGPKRLSAVVLHEKYPFPLRVEAALSLVAMKPRKGRHVGIERLVKGTLVCDPEYDDTEEPCQKRQLPVEERAKLNADLVPALISELQKPPPAPTQNGQPAPDPSFRYKDAAFLMLSYEGTEVIADRELRAQLEKALVDWAMADFETRLEDRNQAFGMEQLLNLIGPPSVERLPQLMTKEGRSLSKIADIIARIGSAKTKEQAGAALVEVAKRVASDAWRTEKASELKEANRARGLEGISEKSFQKQLERYQTETLIRVYASMKKIGGPAVRDFGLEVAADGKVDTAQRVAALAALEGHIGAEDEAAVSRLFALIEGDAPPQVKDKAFARVRELPRDIVAGRLYKLVDGEDWLLRRVAGTTLLTLSKVEHIDEFFKELEGARIENLHLDESLKYGTYLGLLEGGDALAALKPKMTSQNGVVSRLAALSYYYANGSKDDAAALEPFARDPQRIPECKGAEGEDCGWTCVVKEKDEKVRKTIETIGDFVTHCIKPKMMTNEPATDRPGTAPKPAGQPAGQPTGPGDKQDGK
ncbi:MAG: hypothetical protein AAF928_08205 [Myxococcota bacterium]